jgi:predicted DNA binding CopG/RHH family protein
MSNKNNLKPVPQFKSEKEERAFWSKNDSSNYIDWSNADVVVFPNLKPSTKTISIRLPETLLIQVKVAANKKDIPYQSYIKMLLSRALNSEHAKTRKTSKVR